MTLSVHIVVVPAGLGVRLVRGGCGLLGAPEKGSVSHPLRRCDVRPVHPSVSAGGWFEAVEDSLWPWLGLRQRGVNVGLLNVGVDNDEELALSLVYLSA